MTSGSPLWQTIFISFAALLILFQVARGWRLGLPRQLVRVGAIVAAYAAAFFGGPLLLPLLRPLVKIPDLVLSALGGAVLALLVYTIISALGTILFKRTGQQTSGFVRFIYGASGAFVGIFFGAFLVWLLLVGIRSLGAVADAQVRTEARLSEAKDEGYLLAKPARAQRPPDQSKREDSVATVLARLKNSVELGAFGEAVKKADVIPASAYETLGKAGEVLATPETASRFLSFPGAKELSEHPRIIALRDDPEIADMIAQGRFLDLLRDERLISAANDPALKEQVKKFDLRKALDYAAGKN